MAAVLILGGHLLHADVRAAVQGAVPDFSAATVANAILILSQHDARMELRAQAHASGTYEFSNVPIGENYSILAEGPGFRTAEGKNVVLAVDQQVTLNLCLKSSFRAFPVQLLFLAVGERPRSLRFGAEQRLFSKFALHGGSNEKSL
jgi:Carboxypeptidase regulatory-like domain